MSGHAIGEANPASTHTVSTPAAAALNSDATLRYITRSVVNLLRLTESAKAKKYEESVASHRATSTFINEPECMVLRATLISDPETGSTSLKLSNQVVGLSGVASTASVLDVYAIKRHPCTSVTGLEKAVMFMSTQSNPLDTLYLAVQNVIVPQLSVDPGSTATGPDGSIGVKPNVGSAGAAGPQPKSLVPLLSAIHEVSRQLQHARGNSTDLSSESDLDFNSTGIPSSIQSELTRWQRYAASVGVSSKQGNHASIVAELLERIAIPLNDLEAQANAVSVRLNAVAESAQSAALAGATSTTAGNLLGVAQRSVADSDLQLPAPDEVLQILEDVEGTFSEMLEISWPAQPCSDKVAYVRKLVGFVSVLIHTYLRAWIRSSVAIATYQAKLAQSDQDGSSHMNSGSLTRLTSTMTMLGASTGHTVSTQAAQAVQNALNGSSGLGTIWGIPFVSARMLLTTAGNLISGWEAIVDTLYRLAARGRDQQRSETSETPWRDTALAMLGQRFQTVLSYRTLVSELARSLPPSISAQLSGSAGMGTNQTQALAAARVALETSFTHFAHVDILHIGGLASEQFHRAEQAFFAALAPIETAAAGLIASRLAGLLNRPSALVVECASCVSLLQRPIVAQAMAGRLSTLVSALATLSRALAKKATDLGLVQPGDEDDVYLAVTASPDAFEMKARTDENGMPVDGVSPLIEKLIRIGQVLSQAKSLNEANAILLEARKGESAGPDNDVISRGNKIRREAHSLISALLGSQNSFFASWQANALTDFQSTLAAGANVPLMELDRNQGGRLVVHFDDALVTFLRDVRQLCELGFAQRIDMKLKRFAMDLQRRFRYAQAVKRASTFYDAFQSTARPSQLGLLLKEAQAFEETIRANARIDWARGAEVESYLLQLAASAKALERRNVALKSLHEMLESTVRTLLSTSITKRETAWIQGIAQMKGIIAGEARTGNYAPQALQLWATHWEHQIWKVLNFQYRYSLATVSDALPSLTCELAMSRTGAQLRPPIDELRTRAFAAVKELAELPLRFEGLLGHRNRGHTSDTGPQRDVSRSNNALASLINYNSELSNALYARLPAIHAQSIYVAYKGVVAQLSALEAVARRHDIWCGVASMGSEELAELASQNLQSTEDWAHNFASHQKLVKNAARLEEQIVVGCFKVSLLGFRNAVDDALSRLWTALVVSLKRNIAEGAREVEEFASEAVASLSVAPATMEEVGDARAKWRDLNEKRPQFAAKLTALLEKEALLKQHVGALGSSTSVNAALLKQKWSAFEQAHSGFSAMLEDQKEAFKENARRQIAETTQAIERLVSRWSALRPDKVQDGTTLDAKEIVGALRSWDDEYTLLEKQMAKFVEAAAQFGLPDPTGEWKAGYVTGNEIRAAREAWGILERYFDEVNQITDQLWIDVRPRLNTFEDLMRKWQALTRSRTPDQVQEMLTADIKRNLALFPLLQKVSGESFQRDHWKTLFGKLGMPTDTKLETLKMKDFMRVGDAIKARARDITELAARARGEVMIREAFDEVRSWCARAEFSVLPHVTTSGRNTVLIRDWRGLFSQISDQIALLGSLKESPFFGPFEEQANQLESRFGILTQALTQLNEIQRKWLYLEPIFARGALPQEQMRFGRLDSSFRDIMASVQSDPVIMQLTQYPSLLETTGSLLEQLERCQKALVAFLTAKRDKFPRFYFVSDDDLLEILGQADNPSVIDNHVKKLFAGLHRIVFQQRKVVGFESAIGERVTLRQDCVVEVTAAVEDWLSKLLESIKLTLHTQILHCTAELLASANGPDAQEQAKMIQRFASQCLCVAEELAFARRVDACLAASNGITDEAVAFSKVEGGLKKLAQNANDRLVMLTTMAAGSVDPVGESKLKALILTVIHHADVVAQLLQNKAGNPNAWAWQKELRMLVVDSSGSPSDFGSISSQLAQHPYRDSAIGEPTCSINFKPEHYRIVAVMAGAVQDYSYEYQGNEPRLVHTPLTDKCYLVLMQALRLGQGGNPLGPAGTGKTETVKALGQFVGRQVLVFNCDEGIDFHSMGRIFAGIVKSGAWGCFDEFNRLKEDQLSSVSQQIQLIQGALRRGDKTVELLEREVVVNRNAAIFVTLNPASREYGGRSKLPHNLKALFRPVAMSVPDNAQISQVLLYAEGFLSAPVLAKKLVEVFALSRQLLSRQVHYDWGLRALKSVLKQGGLEIAARRKALGSGASLDANQEAALLVSVLRVSTLSKLTHSDSVRFLGLLDDVFSKEITSAAADPRDPQLEAHVAQAFKDLGLKCESRQLRKVMQLYAASRQRMGVALVGPSGSGKSTLLKVLALALERMGYQMTIYTMNPKSLDRQKLLGYMDPDTREWNDGVLTNAARSIVEADARANSLQGDNSKRDHSAQSRGKLSWIVCDGDVDPEWIESLNSVLDDNRLLTMPNGARIRFDDRVNFIFETHDLSFASPATVSRMGVIALSEEDVPIATLVDMWMSSLQSEVLHGNKQSDSKESSGSSDTPSPSPTQAAILELLRTSLDALLAKTIQYVEGLSLAANIEARGLVQSVLSHLNAVFRPILLLRKPPQTLGESQLRAMFVAAFALGFGAAILPEQRQQLTTQLCEWAGVPQSLLPSPAAYAQHITVFSNALAQQLQPSPHSAHYGHDGGSSQAMELDGDALPLLVETPEVAESLAILKPWLLTPAQSGNIQTVSAPASSSSVASSLTLSSIHSYDPILVIGPEGSGKTRIVKTAVRALRGTTVATLHCNSQTKAIHAIQKLLEVTALYTTNMGKVLRPKDGNRVVLLLKDLNLPSPDKYRTSQLVELLIQLISRKGFYDENLEWIYIENVQIIATAAPPGTVGRHLLSQRFVSAAKVLYVSYASDQNLVSIYTHMVKSVVSMPTFFGIGGTANVTSNAEPITNSTISSSILRCPTPPDWTSQQACVSVAQAMIECYRAFKNRFSPDDFRHYQCSPRDLTRWIIGLRKHALADPSEFPAVWAYEADRVFGDRIVDASSRSKFRMIILNCLKRWGIDANSVLSRVSVQATSDPNDADRKVTSAVDLVFQALIRTSLADPYGEKQSTILTHGQANDFTTGFLQKRAELTGNLLEPSSLQEFGEVLAQAKYAYERDYRPLDITLVVDTISRASHLERSLGAPGGSALLVGDAGAGKRGLVLLVANMLGYHTVIPKTVAQNAATPEQFASMSSKLFRAELKELVSLAVSPMQAASSASGGAALAAAASKGCLLVLEDCHLDNDMILQDVNSLLSGGEVPGLFTASEYEALLSSIRAEWRQSLAQAAESEADGDSKSAEPHIPTGVCRTASEYLARKIQRQLHVALCLNPAHPQFAVRLAANPALLGRCATVWIGGWSSETMQAFTRRRLQPIIQHMERELEIRSQAASGAKTPSIDPNSLIRIAQYIHQTRTDAKDSRAAMLEDGATAQSPAITGRGPGAGVGPAKFVAFLDTYLALYHRKQRALSHRRAHLQRGLSKLDEAAATVEGLREKARNQQALIAAKQAEADAALTRITEAMTIVAGRQQEANELKASLEGEETKLGERRTVIEAELGEIIPMVEEAKRKVGTIQRDHINEVRSYAMPPPEITHVLAAVLTLMGSKDLTWTGMKKFLSDPSTKEKLVSFDASTLSKDARMRVQQLVNKTPDSFEQKRIANVSAAAAPLAEWTLAQLRYASALEVVRPKQLELERADHALQDARTRQKAVAEELVKLNEEVQTLRASFAKITAEAESLKIGLEKIEQTLSRAGGLLDKLGGERERWGLQVRQLTASLVALPFNALLAAAAITYLGGETESARARALDDWREKCRLKRVDFLSFIATEAQRLQWKEHGLGADSLSQQNAGIILATLPFRDAEEDEHEASAAPSKDDSTTPGKGALSPLTSYVIDPSGRALNWLVKQLNVIVAAEKPNQKNAQDGNRESLGLILDGSSSANSTANSTLSGAATRSRIEVTTMQSERFLNTLELAVRFGKTLLIQEVDTIPAFLYPLIRKDLQRAAVGGTDRSVVQIGEKFVEYHPSFSLVLFTRDPSPAVPPVLASSLCIVSFSSTRMGLEQALLASTLSKEHPALEKQQSELLAEEEQCKRSLSKLEDDLLEALARAEGDLLENQELVEKLDATKSQAQVIEASLTKSRVVQATLTEQREAYRPVAELGATLYFAISQLVAVNNMYSFALPEYFDLYSNNHTALVARLTGKNMECSGLSAAELVPQLRSSLISTVYGYVSRGLFKHDHLMFAMHILHRVRPDLVPEPLWNFFLGKSTGAAENGQSQQSGFTPASWISQELHGRLRELATACPSIIQRHRLADESATGAWRTWLAQSSSMADANDDFLNSMPTDGNAASHGDYFQRLALVYVLKPELVLSAAAQIAKDALGLASLAPPSLDFAMLAEEGKGARPILFLTSAGTDPSFEVEQLAEKHFSALRKPNEPKTDSNSLVQIAMGSGQTEAAQKVIRAAMQTGGWVLLKNVHLVSAWLPALEKLLRAVESPHPGFRLWLTTEEHPTFPALLLQRCIKVAYEAPPGVRQNMLRTYSGWDDEYLALGNNTARAQLLFSLAAMHAVIQERRSFVPQGWLKAHEFSQTDLRSAADIVDMCFADAALAQLGSTNPSLASRVITLVSQRHAEGTATPSGHANYDLQQRLRSSLYLPVDVTSSPQALKILFTASEVNVTPESITWQALWSILRIAVYGGRLDSEQDVRILTTYLRKFLAPDIVSANPQVAPRRKPLLGLKGDVPASLRTHDFVQLINSLPDLDQPAIFDLPSNAAATLGAQRAIALAQSLRSLVQTGVISQGFNRAIWKSSLEPLIWRWRQLRSSAAMPKPGTTTAVAILRRNPSEWTPIEAFFQLEFNFASAIAEAITKTLEGLANVLIANEEQDSSKAVANLNRDLEIEGATLLQGNVPAQWLAVGPGGWWPTSPEACLSAVAQKFSGLRDCINFLNEQYARTQDASNALLSRPLLMSTLFRPRTYLDALRQYTARMTSTPIDTLKLVAAWSPNHLPHGGNVIKAQVDGFSIQGASLRATEPNAPLALMDVDAAGAAFERVPTFFIAFVPQADPDPYATNAGVCPVAGIASIPVYEDPSREGLVCELKLPITGRLPKWILAGVALVLTTQAY